ncbi:hypothetical protein BCV69DRAFT_315045 [Microstroma glucosiphilum]|uniref:RING-type E3 ubiquitin transferase n=1 Tax=Pseudomicrostroma glucosiphilum TaxID=1684307 RepID=A0A316TWS7_9BASI|nr:hypothetical protein BCV69DRAFT_315045 [Pseudomicrostroma glucosiphilum]PWN17922.1 hypothetical protein BCV69DRAFT_315045 [Pseudomicrostroma glucosiphilum]
MPLADHRGLEARIIAVGPYPLRIRCRATNTGPLSMATSSHPQAGPSRTHLPSLEPALPPQHSHIRPPPPTIVNHIQDDNDDVKDVDALAADEPEESCLICLTSPIIDRSILPNCSHSLFCFRCILTWIQVSSASYKGKARQGSPGGVAGEGDEEECRWGRCPLCNRGIGRYILHAVRRGRRGDVNWERWWLRRGEHTSGYGREDEEVQRAARRSILEERRRRRSRQDGATPRNSSRDTTGKQADLDFARQITQRRQIYSHGRYAKHLGSNPTTGLGPPPSPSAIRAKPHLLSSALPSFLRRELLALPLWSSPTSSSNSSSSTSTTDPTMTATSTALDVPFLITYLRSLLQHLDVRSEGFVKLLGEVLGDGPRERQLAEHFSHELGVFLRLGARGNVKRFDAVVAYDVDGEEEAERVNGTRERRARDEGRAGSKRQRESSREQTSGYGPARGPSLSPRPQITAPEEGGQAFPSERVSLSPSPSSSPPSAPPPPAPDRQEIISKRSLLLQRLAAASAEQRERALKEQLRVAVKAKGTAKGLDGNEAGVKPADEGGDSIDEEKKEEHRAAAAAVADGGSTSPNQQREEELRRSLVEARTNKAKAKGTLAAARLVD